MIEYIFKSALSLALLYSLFFVCLSRETFHRFNRVCLLLIMLASLVLPMVHLTVGLPTVITETVIEPTTHLVSMPVATDVPEAAPALTWGTLLSYIYLAGVAVMLIFLTVQVCLLARQMRGGLRHTDERGNTVILHPGVKSPFSIFRWIVMSVDDYELHRRSILTHEQEHIRLGHTYDLLLLEAMRMFQWFNPFIWFLSHDLRALHEYEADEAVINQGIDAKQYQQLLVLKAVGNRLQPFANCLRRGSLKQRIIMMYQKKSNRWMMLKVLFVLPTMGFVLYAFATPECVPDVQTVSQLRKQLLNAGALEDHILIQRGALISKPSTEPVLEAEQENPLQTAEDTIAPVISPREAEGLLSPSDNTIKVGQRITGQVVVLGNETEPLSSVEVAEVTPEGKVVSATITDMNGQYQLKVNDVKSLLKFSKTGYLPLEQPVSATPNVALKKL